MITLRKFLTLNPDTANRKLLRLLGDFEQLLSGGSPGSAAGGQSPAPGTTAPDDYRRFFSELAAVLEKREALGGIDAGRDPGGRSAGGPGTRVRDGEAQTPGDRRSGILIPPSELDTMVTASYGIHGAFAANRLRHRLMTDLGKFAADWDTGKTGAGIAPDDSTDLRLDPGNPPRLPRLKHGEKALYLDDIRSPYNVGAIFRSAAFFGVSMIFLSPDTPAPGVRRLDRVSMGASATIPWGVIGRQDFIASFEEPGEESGRNTVEDRLAPAAQSPEITGRADPVAWCGILETGGDNILTADLPDSGWLILGNEELGVHPDLLGYAKDGHKKSSADWGDGAFSVLSIPAKGSKASLNVSVACGIALSRWFMPG